MSIQFREAGPADRENIRNLLSEAHLPAETVGGDATTFYVAEDSAGIVGIAGFEYYGDDALLRSVAIRPDLQKRGLGSQIVDLMIGEAVKRNVRDIVLLTETARDFFLKEGFNVVDRQAVQNEALKKSSEFSYACPTSAVCMVMKLK